MAALTAELPRDMAREVAASPYARGAALHIAVQLVGVAMLALLAGWHDLALVERLTAWDGQWYLNIAEDGYFGIEPGVLLDANGEFFPDAALAFFPLYPMLMSLFSGWGISAIAAGLAISALAGIVTACGIVRLVDTLGYSRKAGLIAVALFAGAPMAISLSMVYTEALFCAFAVWALVGVVEKRWIMAGVCCMYSGTVRSSAAVLIAVVVIAALLCWWRERDKRALVAAGIAPLGLLGYWGYVANETASLTGWMDIEQRGWHMGWDWGVETWHWWTASLASGNDLMNTVAALLLPASLVLAAICARRLPWQLTAYGMGIIVLTIGTGGLPWSKSRLLLVGMFVLLIPVAAAIFRLQRSTIYSVVAAVLLVGMWYSAYSLTGWEHSI